MTGVASNHVYTEVLAIHAANFWGKPAQFIVGHIELDQKI